MNRQNSRRRDVPQWIAGRTAKPMFWMSMSFLVCIACLVVLWVDVPNLQEKALGESTVVPELIASSSIRGKLESLSVLVIVLIWPVVVLESVVHWLTRPWDAEHRKYHLFGFLFVLCPALRMCARCPEMGDRLWLPGLGWRRADKRLRRRLERQFGLPMIIIALMIMPILIVEFFLKAQVAQYAWLRFLLHVGTGVIWFAFAAEFILMVSVADKKLAYCKKHWIDLAIILLPLFSFLRSLRMMRATKIAKLMRIPQVGKLARVYRLRGTAIKAIQALVLLEVFQRWSGRNPERSLTKLRRQLAEVQDEAKAIRRKISRLEKQQKAIAKLRDAAEQVILDEENAVMVDSTEVHAQRRQQSVAAKVNAG